MNRGADKFKICLELNNIVDSLNYKHFLPWKYKCNPVQSWYIAFFLFIFLPTLRQNYWCVAYIDLYNDYVLCEEPCFFQCFAFPPPPPSLVLQGHLNADSMDEKHFEKLWLCSSRYLPHPSPTSLCKAHVLHESTEIIMWCFKTDDGKIHQLCISWASVFSLAKLWRLWQTVNSAESILLLSGNEWSFGSVLCCCKCAYWEELVTAAGADMLVCCVF